MKSNQTIAFWSILFILLCGSVYAQEISPISLKARQDTIKCIKPCNTATALLTITNQSDYDILVYGLTSQSASPAFSLLSELCDQNQTGTGIEFALYHPDLKQELAEFGVVDDKIRKKPMTKKMLDSVLHVLNLKFVSGGIILKSREEKLIVSEVPLDKFNLKKGLYYIQFVYYCGTKSAELLDSYGVVRPARLFQGCAISPTIPFFVNYTRKSKWSR